MHFKRKVVKNSNEIGGLILLSAVFITVLGIDMFVHGLIEASKYITGSTMLYVSTMCLVGTLLFELGIYIIKKVIV